MAGFWDMKSKLAKAEWVANWATFLTARLMCHILIIYKVIKDAPRFGKGVEFPLAFLGMVGMNVLNIFLGLDLYKAYKRENLGNEGKKR
ncbi:hypothetical protein ACLOJK_001158 [Asimina triloba]